MRPTLILPATTAIAAGVLLAADQPKPAPLVQKIALDFAGSNGAARVSENQGTIPDKGLPPDKNIPAYVLFAAAPGDEVIVCLDSPAGARTGKTVKFTAIPKYKFESKSGCKKKIEYRELPSPFVLPKSLTVGQQLHVLVRQVRSSDRVAQEPLKVVFGTPAEIKVNEPVWLWVELKFTPGDVAFVQRPLTDAERQKHIDPIEAQALARPNVVAFRVADETVLAGDVAALKARMVVTRGQPR